MRCFLAVAVAAIAASNAVRASAQAPADTTRRARILDTIVVTATRSASSAPVSAVSVIHGDDLRREGITHLADALRSLPGVMIVQTGSTGGLTTMYMRGGDRGYTRVLVDGVPVNEPGGGFDLAQLSTYDIERVEIVRGPASVLYGSDAVTGVVQVFTRSGRHGRTWRGSARAGTFGTSVVEAYA